MQAKYPWATPIEELYKQFSTSEKGLTDSEAKLRLKQYGPNIIPDKDRREWTDILVSQLSSPFLLILISAAVLSAFMGESSDTLIIFLVILASVALGFFQEYKSEKILAELKKHFSYHAGIIRNSERAQIDSHELVPGDIVTVGLGDIVPADIRLISTQNLILNESVITGESREVKKEPAKILPENSAPHQLSNFLFMGSTAVSGYGMGIVVATGPETFFGRTAAQFSAKVPESEFQTGIRKFGTMLTRVIFAMTLFVFIVNFGLGHGGANPLADSALFALALAVGIAPEALPVIITIALSTGSAHLAKKKVIVKKLAAIEDLGNMDTLCTDKTGTLTDEALRFAKYVDLDKKDSRDVFEYSFLCNSAVGSKKIRGNPIDSAIRKHGLEMKLDVSRFSKIEEIQFDFERRRMGQVVEEGGKRFLIVKGASESILSVCGKARTSSKEVPISKFEKEAKKMVLGYSNEGLSTIAVAYKEIGKKKEYSKEDEEGLILLGFVLFNNPPKATTKQTFDRLKSLNVNLKILTGDDPIIAKNLCEQIGIPLVEGRVVSGSELSKMSGEEFNDTAEKYNLFARVTPDQKLAIVEALRGNNHVVGFLGDGINDAPAIRTADVGISVDSAADVAKGASHIILMRKSLNVVADGVEEGRRIFGNIMKYINITMSANNGNMITVALSSLFLPFLPLLPVQILLINLVSDLPMIAIATDKVDKSLTRQPRRWDTDLILKFMLFFGLISTLFDLILIWLLNYHFQVDVDTFRTAWFMMSIFTEILVIFSLRTYLPFFRSMPSTLLTLSCIGAFAVTFAAVYIPVFAAPFSLIPLSPFVLSICIGVLLLYFFTNELFKPLFVSKFAPETLRNHDNRQ